MDIQSVKFDKGSEIMFWKTSHTQEEFYSSQFLQRKLIKSLGNDFLQIEKTWGVSTFKKENIVSMQNLPVIDEAVKLIVNHDLSE